MIRRREFITLLGGAAAAWPLPARAQQPTMPVIGFLGIGSSHSDADQLRAFRQGLGESGLVEGRSVTIEYRWAEGHNDRLPDLADQLVRRRVNVIVTTGGAPPALAAKAVTRTIPIVFWMGADPVQVGLVASLNQPGGNLTGVTTLGTELGPKRMEMLRALIPTAKVVAVLVNPTNPLAGIQSRDFASAAHVLGLELHVLHASSEDHFAAVFDSLARLKADALVIGGDGFFNSRIEQLGALTVRRAVPGVYQYRLFAAAGGLMSYGGSLADSHRLAGVYAGRILKGEKAAELPVQQSTKVELLINLKTAKTLGLEVPPSLLARADEVIE
jgi:putative tryptophan/tyrosine transport system substrate-binding protein